MRESFGSMKIDFVNWLQTEIEKRGWSQNELIRRARASGHKLTSSQLSRLMKREQSGTVEVIIGIADGLNLPREEVFRAKGWLLTEPVKILEPEIDPRAAQLARKVSALPFKSRELAFEAMEPMLDSIGELTSEIQQLSANGQHA